MRFDESYRQYGPISNAAGHSRASRGQNYLIHTQTAGIKTFFFLVDPNSGLAGYVNQSLCLDAGPLFAWVFI